MAGGSYNLAMNKAMQSYEGSFRHESELIVYEDNQALDDKFTDFLRRRKNHVNSTRDIRDYLVRIRI